MSDTHCGRDSNAMQSCGGFEVNPSREYVKDISRVWESIYGANDSKRHERIKRLQEQLDGFWQCILQDEETKKNNLVNEIEKKAHEAFNLERALGLPQKVDELGNSNPLMHLQQQVQQLLEEYYKIKEKRLEEFSNLHAEEKQLCSILNENPMIEILESGSSEKIPRLDYMRECNDRIDKLRQQKDTLYQDFESYRETLKVLMKDLGILPFREFERYACGIGTDYPVTIQNMIKMKNQVEEYTERKEKVIAKADHLRSEIKHLWKKLYKDQFELDELIVQHSDFKEATLQTLASVVEELRKERKLKIKELILVQRKILDGLWEKCFCSDDERVAVAAYRVDHYTEDILDLHEMEVERLENFYNNYRKIFELTEKHSELWDRLLHLEELASDKNRLFNNRGGQLLKEEKERKTIQKKLPAIKAELVKLLNEYHAQRGQDFLYFGNPLIDILDQMEQDRDAAKENQKLQRKVANHQTVLQETRLGSRPVPTAGMKRKMLTPQTPGKVMKMSSTASITKSSAATSHQSELGRAGARRRLASPVRTDQSSSTSLYATPLITPVPPLVPAASTPENGSLSYESFQEQIEKSKIKEAHSSTRNQPHRVTRQRVNDTMILRPTTSTSRVLKPSQNINLMPPKTPRKTPTRTPSKTPSKIPFRVATGSKIPSIVPPVSPRGGPAKLMTPRRNKLPIIF